MEEKWGYATETRKILNTLSKIKYKKRPENKTVKMGKQIEMHVKFKWELKYETYLHWKQVRKLNKNHFSPRGFTFPTPFSCIISFLFFFFYILSQFFGNERQSESPAQRKVVHLLLLLAFVYLFCCYSANWIFTHVSILWESYVRWLSALMLHSVKCFTLHAVRSSHICTWYSNFHFHIEQSNNRAGQQ